MITFQQGGNGSLLSMSEYRVYNGKTYLSTGVYQGKEIFADEVAEFVGDNGSGESILLSRTEWHNLPVGYAPRERV